MQLRQLQAQIKAEEDFLREHQRRAIKAKAEGDLADRVAAFHAKNTTKDQITSRRKQVGLRSVCTRGTHVLML